MTKNHEILNAIRVHIYNGDDRLAIRLYCENRISKKDFDEAVALGRKQRREAAPT